MILYISTEINSQLFINKDVLVKTYIKWQYNVGNFIKEEYANINSMQPDAIVIDCTAFKDFNNLNMLSDVIKETKFILIADSQFSEEKINKTLLKENGNRWDVIKLDEHTADEVIKKVYPEESGNDNKVLRIGIMCNDEKHRINTAFNILESIKNYRSDICCIEVAKKSVMDKYVDDFNLIKKDNYYVYKEIPILFNLAKDNIKLSVLLFNEIGRSLFERCDYSLELKNDELIYDDQSFEFLEFNEPISEDRTDIYDAIFGDGLGFRFRKSKKIKRHNVINSLKRRILTKNRILLFALTTVLIALLITTFTYAKKSADKTTEKSNNFIVTTTQEITTMPEIIETTAVEETSTEEVVTTKKQVIEEKTSKKKTTKKKNKENKTTRTVTSKQKETTKRVTSKPKETAKQKRQLGTYSEKNVISKSKVNVIRNSITSEFSGSVSKEKQSLAAYMSKNGLKNAESTYKKLTNSEKSFRCKTCSIKINTDSEEEIINAAEKATSKIGSISSDYGIGICTTRKNVGYGIFIVVIY